MESTDLSLNLIKLNEVHRADVEENVQKVMKKEIKHPLESAYLSQCIQLMELINMKYGD